MTDPKKSAYLQLAKAEEFAVAAEVAVEGVAIHEAVAVCLLEVSQQLGAMITQLLNNLDVARADEASRYKLRVDFMILHIDQEIISLIDNSDELAAVQETLKAANKNLKKIKTNTENLAANLGRAAAILGEFEKLVKWVKAQ